MNRIKECRINAKMSQKFVAVTLGIAAPSVSNWESGKTQPTPENLKRLAALFGVSVDYLIGRADEASMVLSTFERDLLFASRAADKRAREHALTLLNAHQKK